MVYKPPIWYEARIAFGLASLLPALMLPAYALFGLIAWTLQERRPNPAMLGSVYEMMLPLAAGLLAAHLMSIEREEQFDHIRRSYPEPAWRVPLVRTIGALVLTVGAVVIGSLIFHVAVGGFALADVLIPAISPTLYLLGLSILLNNVTGNYWAAVTVVIGYWFLEYVTMGRYSGMVFLFRATMPNAFDYDLNRALLVGLALVWFALNIAYSSWRRRVGG